MGQVRGSGQGSLQISSRSHTSQIFYLSLSCTLGCLSSTGVPGECLRARSCALPFRRVPGMLADSLPFPADRIPADFHCQILCRLHIAAQMLWRVVPGMGWRPRAPQGGMLLLRYPFRFSVATCGCRGQPFLCLCSSYQSLWDFFCNSLDVILLFSRPSVGHSGWLLYNLAVNPVWHWEEVSVTFIYSAAL